MAVAAKFAPNASPKVIAKLARRLDGLPLTVVRDSDGNIAAAAALKPNSHGTFGRTLREKVAPNTTTVTHLAGDEAGIAQAVSAAAEGVERFLPKQKAFSLVTDNPQVAASIDAGSVTTNPMIRRSAPELFANMTEAQRPPGVTEALTPPNGKPLTASEQLHRLNEIPIDERTAWPIGTQKHSVTVAYDRPLMELGQEWVGKLVHPMHPDSYLGKFNSRVNPVRNIVEGVKYLGRLTRREPVPSDGTKDLQVFPPHPKTGLARVATLYPKGTLQKDPALLRQLAEAQVEATRPLGSSASINLLPEAERVANTMESLKKRAGVVVVSDIDGTGARTPAGLAAISKFEGHNKGATGQFPFLSEREVPPGAFYLSDVAAIGKAKGGGNQAFLSAVDAARATGAREMVFHTQGEAAVSMYNRAGAHPAGQSAPEGAPLPGLIATHARFGTGAAEVLKNELSLPEAQRMIPRELRQAVAEKTLPELQRHLEGLGDQLQDMSARVRGGALLTSYRLAYSPSSRSQALRWAVEDATRPARSVMATAGTRLKTFEKGVRISAGSAVDKLKPPASAVKRGAGVVNSALNPYALPQGIEPGPLRGKLQTAGYAAQFISREGWKTTRAALAVSAAAQAAVGHKLVKEDDDALIRPFNGMPGSRSVGVYFPLTGTMVVGWRAGGNARGAWPLDENGLMPLARVSAPMTDPKGPKGAGFLSAARLAPVGELNAGIRWFGSNNGVSALSAVSVRPMPFNFNLRGDVPVQKGAVTNLSALGSITGLMPSVSHAFYWGRGGVLVRNLHVTMGGSLQAATLSPAARASGYRAGNHYTLGSNGVSGGTGLFFTLNAAYGHPDPSFYD